MTDSLQRGASFSIRSRNDINSRLARVALDSGLVDKQRIENLQHRSLWIDVPLEKLMLQEGLVSEKQLIQLLSRITDVPVLNMTHLDIELETIETVSARTVTAHNIIPVKMKGGVVTLATDHIWETTDEDHLRVIIGYSIDWMLATSQEIKECIKHYYGVGIETFLNIKSHDKEVEGFGTKTAAHDGEDVPAFVREIIREAVGIDATDIHIEPTQEGLRVRYRIDGVLQEFPLPSGVEDYAKPVISSVKIMAQMNIAEHRKPQDGRFSIKIDSEEFDVRVSVLPMQFGETVNLRILNREATFINLDELGLSTKDRTVLEDMISLPYGMVLFTGPTGSGKTTSLYAALAYLNNAKRKIITLEDPIEYKIEGITQMQMESRIGFDFSTSLRYVLRHDPDVVLVGEIRDPETADISVSAALTGHLVFSTLHTNDSVGALTRLLDMEVEPYLVASALEGAVAQRLMRSICTQCKDPHILETALFSDLKVNMPDFQEAPTVYEGRGCPYCRFTGYRGRQPVFEIMRMDDELRSMTTKHSNTKSLMDCAIRKKGLETLRQKGWRKVVEGKTSVEELYRVTRSDR